VKADAWQRLPRAMSRYVWVLSVQLYIQDAAIECQDIPIAVLAIRVEYKKNYGESAVKYRFFFLQLRLASFLPDMQYIPVIAIRS
jgi:hypothetical protein